MQKELENLRLVLTEPRLRSPDTLTGYLSMASQFLTWLGDRIPPDEMDLRRYFGHSREEGKSDNTRRTLFAVLKKLYHANHWDWPLQSTDRPPEPEETFERAFTREEIAQLIKNRDLYSKGERFYLAIGTIYAPRRIELARIKKRDIKESTLRIDTAKRGEKRTHLIPDEILPYIQDYHPQENNVSSLSAMFGRICDKGLGKKMRGYGWHSFRYPLNTLLPAALAKGDKDITLVGHFLRWSRKEFGRKIFGTPMVGVYRRAELLSSDPFFIDREVFQVHPFLPLWVDQVK